MYTCPYCDSALDGNPSRQVKRTNQTPGHKDTGSELVSCPDCDRVIDGFAGH